MIRDYLEWKDIGKQFHCGRGKALKIMHELKPNYIGRTPVVTQEQIDRYLAEHGDIKIDWKY